MSRLAELARQVLYAEQPRNVGPESVTITGEGNEVGIVLLPHRDLGGYSLVLWMDDRRAAVGWAGIADLARHDDIDLARWVLRVDASESDADNPMKVAVAAELDRPIRVMARKTRIRRRWQLWCAIESSNRWLESYVCDVQAPDVAQGDRIVEFGMTTLRGPSRPSIQRPPPVGEWRRWADPAWPSG
jgi:hypothetical protein